MTAEAWRREAVHRLREADNPDAQWDADLLLCEALGCEKGRLRFLLERELSCEAAARLEEQLKRRLSGEPLQYILGSTCFMGLTFRCDARALIPRQDTETLAEEAIHRLTGRERPRVLDLCCGSGCIGLSIAHCVPGVQLTLSDLSGEALSLSRENAQALGIQARFLQGDMFAPCDGERFDLIACNPPYLTAEDMQALQQEVRSEPDTALFGGEDGLDFYRRLAAEAGAHLCEGGVLLAECGMGQAGEVARLFEAIGETRVLRDLCGVERVVVAGGQCPVGSGR